jgi:hypothetical protein
MSKYEIVLEILDKLINVIEQRNDADKTIQRFLNECLYFKQEIEEGRIIVPMDSIKGYLLSYIIAEDYFYNKEELKTLSAKLYENIVVHDIIDY